MTEFRELTFFTLVNFTNAKNNITKTDTNGKIKCFCNNLFHFDAPTRIGPDWNLALWHIYFFISLCLCYFLRANVHLI